MQALEFFAGYIALMLPFVFFFVKQGKEITWIKLYLKMLLRKNGITFDD
jgi:hypothetical protein